ncbi:hypothetical protein ABEG17_06470 [Pedococcus sp. KACC 23699]|uniref:Uncharacterized protein n=1 Tax=Pedococcus sp. KACC 23699 TaxID=3149228 RepID=A0AAU7JXH3_9MICO
MTWIVVPSITGGWDVFTTGTNEAVAHAESAEAAASAAARRAGTDGWAVIMGANGRPQRELRVDANGVLTDNSDVKRSNPVDAADADKPNPVLEAVERVHTDWDDADKWTGRVMSKWLPLVALIVGPSLNGLIRPAIASQTTFVGVFFSTLAWSLGIAMPIIMLGTFEPENPLAGGAIVVGCLYLGMYVAQSVGEGTYTESVPLNGTWANSGTQLHLIGIAWDFVHAAMVSFGVIGALIGAVSGGVFGRWVCTHVLGVD